MRKFWTWEDDELIKHAAREGISLSRLAIKLKRSELAVKTRAQIVTGETRKASLLSAADNELQARRAS